MDLQLKYVSRRIHKGVEYRYLLPPSICHWYELLKRVRERQLGERETWESERPGRTRDLFYQESEKNAEAF